MSKSVRKSKAKDKKDKKESYSLYVRDIINKVENAYSMADKKLEEISTTCTTKECKLKG